MKEVYRKQVDLLLRCLPEIEREKCFALKGGTAINLFVLDMPRLSVDIDLTYLPIEARDESLNGICTALRRIKKGIEQSIIGAKVEGIAAYGVDVARLMVRRDDVTVKVEPNFILRGTVFPSIEMELCQVAQREFELFTTALVVSHADLYGGKLCAALDRQHPRDLFDIKWLLETEGLSDSVRKAFVVYLASHNRPMHELLSPNLLDISSAYEGEFMGMVDNVSPLQELEAVREDLVRRIQQGLTDKERAFLLSVKRGDPDWNALDVSGIEKLPGIQWKLVNIQRMNKSKHNKLLAKLEKVLET